MVGKVINGIQDCELCGCPMDMSLVDPFMSFVCPDCEHPLQNDFQLGQYRIISFHAEGGMSRIYEAHDELLDRRVAIKILNDHYSKDAARVAQFEQEARITSSVNHPNVVRVFTVGEDFGHFYIVMEMVKGQSLEQRMAAEQVIQEDEALSMIFEIISGLRAAKNVELIHRDIKPGNILFDEKGRVKIVDFGLALMTDEGSVKADEIWATPFYVPPEALDGREEDLRSDMYALGATLYHALSGKAPIPEDIKTTGSVRRAKEEIASLALAAPWLHVETCKLIDQAMAISPDDRFQTYRDMEAGVLCAIDALEKSRQEEIVPLAADEQDSIVLKKSRSSQGGLAALVALCVVLVVTVIVLFFMRDTESGGEAVVKNSLVKLPNQEGEQDELSSEVSFAGVDDAYFHSAYISLSSRDYTSASEAFFSFMKDEKVPQPRASWCGVEALISLYLSGEDQAASEKLYMLSSQLPTDSPTSDQLFKTLVSQLQSLESIPLVDAGNADEAIVYYMAGALRNWQAGEWPEAIQAFKKVVSEQVNEGDLYSVYPSLAQLYLNDFQKLQPFIDMPSPRNIDELRHTMTSLKEVMGSLETKGRACFFTRNWQLRLHRVASVLSTSQP